MAQFDWQWFVTLTFREAPHPERARKSFLHWIDWVNRRAYGRHYRGRTLGIYWALASELQSRGAIHFHVLVGDTGDINRVSRREARNRWYGQCGLGRVDPITSRLRAVTNYVSKYVSKGGDIEFSESLAGYRRQLSMETD